MNLQTLQQQIIGKTLDNLYVFVGDEIAIQKIYINKMAEVAGLEVKYISNYKEITKKSNKLFGAKCLYVILDDIDITKKEEVWDSLSSDFIIFKYSTLDKRGKFYKHFENHIVEFAKLSDEVLERYIQKEIPLRTCNCDKLILMCNSNYNQILLEIDKIKKYNIYDDMDIRFLELDNLGAFYKEVSDQTFEFIDAIIKRDTDKLPKLQKEWQRQNDSCLGLLSLLYNNIKTILLIQSCKSNDICKTTGLQNNQVYYNKEKTGYYSIGELVRAMKIIQKVDTAIKKGLIEEQIALDYVLVNIL